MPTPQQEEAYKGVAKAFTPSNEAQTQALAGVKSAFLGNAQPKPPVVPEPVVPEPIVPDKSTVNVAPVTPDYLPPTTQQPTPADDYLSTLKPKTEEEIRLEKTQAAQSQIDSLNTYYDTQLQGEQELGDVRARRTSAISTLTGLAGSSEASTSAQATDEKTQKALAAVNAERGAAIQQILSDIRTSAVAEARQSRLEARQSAEDVITMRANRKAEAIETLSVLGSGAGASIEGIKSQLSSEDYDYLMKNVGGEAYAKQILFNAHKDTVVGKPTRVGDYMAQTYQTPDGGYKTEYIKLPEEVLATDPNLFKTINTDNGTFISTDGGKTYTSLLGSAKPIDETEQAYKQAQMAQIQAKTAKIYKETEQIGVGGGTDGVELTPTQLTEANSLAQQVYGGTTIRTKDGYNNFVVPIINRMKAGESIDNIADSLRYKGQSVEFTGAIRDSAQQITSNYTDKKTQVIFDKLDDLLEKGDVGGTRDYLKKMAIDSLGVDEARQMKGKERTVEFLQEIQADLDKLEAMGINTNIFTGTYEGIAKKVGTIKDKESRKVATKIATAIQTYRRSMSGVAFSVPESEEYKAMFPDIGKTANFNKATIEALSEVFTGDLDYMYNHIMGDSYDELFKGKKQDIQQQAESQQVEYNGQTYNVDANGEMTLI